MDGVSSEMLAAGTLGLVVLWSFAGGKGRGAGGAGRKAIDAFDALRRNAAGTALEKAAAEAPDNPYLSGFGLAKKSESGDPKPVV